MRDNLDRFPQILAVSLLVQDIPVNLSGRQVGILVQVLVNEALIMSKVKVCFRAILRHIHLAVLVRTHRPRIYINIRIQLLGGDLEASRLEKSAKACCRNALAKAGNHTAGYKDIFCRHFPSPPNAGTFLNRTNS